MPDGATPRRIRVLIVDDHPVVRNGLTTLLSAEDDFIVVGAGADGEEGIALAVEERPDIVLMDYSMPGMDGVEASRRIRDAIPDTRVVFLTSFSDRDKMVAAFRSGAVSYLLKDSEPEKLIRGIRNAAESIGQIDK